MLRSQDTAASPPAGVAVPASPGLAQGADRPAGRRSPGYPGNASLPHLLLLPHDLQLLGQLDLALALCLLRCTAQLLPMLLPQRVQSPTRVPDLGQFVLQAFVVHWGGKRQPQGPSRGRALGPPLHTTSASLQRSCVMGMPNPSVGGSPGSRLLLPRTPSHTPGWAAPTYACVRPAG